MKPTDIAHLNQALQGYYGDRYAGLTTPMLDLWYEKLRGFPAELGIPAVKRWAAGHLPHQIPTLNDLAELMEQIQIEQRSSTRQKQWEAGAELSERDDDYSSAEVRALIHSIWPEMYPEPKPPMKPEERDARVAFLKAQVAQIIAEEERQ